MVGFGDFLSSQYSILRNFLVLAGSCLDCPSFLPFFSHILFFFFCNKLDGDNVNIHGRPICTCTESFHLPFESWISTLSLASRSSAPS